MISDPVVNSPVTKQDKIMARSLVRAMAHFGMIAKPDKCERCGRVRELDGHHEDYRKPHQVKWLCVKCHGFIHRKPRLKPPVAHRFKFCFRCQRPIPLAPAGFIQEIICDYCRPVSRIIHIEVLTHHRCQPKNRCNVEYVEPKSFASLLRP